MELIGVEVVDARPRGQTVVALKVRPGTTLAQAIAQAGLAPGAAVGVFGRARSPDEPAADGDRIEIYRKLVMDPKDRRRRMAARRA